MEEQLLKSLNDEQKQAVTTTEGYVRVIAGAGSGKTRALTYRYAYLVQIMGISPDKILSVTFTNKASFEMKRRIRELIGDYDTGYINTFHGFCNGFLKQEIYKLNYPNNFQIMDEGEQKTILKEIYKELNLTTKDYTYDAILDYISRFKDGNRDYVALMTEPNLEKLSDLIDSAKNNNNIEQLVLYKYIFKQRKLYNLDFDDLIYFTLFYLNNFSDILIKWQEQLEYIQVDEFQDVSQCQFELVSLLSQKHQNLFIVGDPDQNIYSWRGSRIEYILEFDKTFPNAKTIYLNKNYRSCPEILKATNSLIKKNVYRLEKDLIPQKQNSSQKPIYYHGKDSFDEANWILENIKQLLSMGIRAEEIAVLYRANYLSRPIEETFIMNKINYIIYNGIDFYSRKEIKDCIAYLKLAVRDDDISFLRVINVPARNIGQKRIDFLKQCAEQNFCSLYQALKDNIDNPLFKNTEVKNFLDTVENSRKIKNLDSITNTLDFILKNSGYENELMKSGDQERLDNIKEFKDAIDNYETNIGERDENILEDYLNQLALYTDKESKTIEGKIKLMTIHASKGLEFQYVFVCGLNEGIFPSSRVKFPREIEEERRLAYVAFTRAEDGLFLSDAEGRTFDGNFRYPSRFLFDIDKVYIKYENIIEDDLLTTAERYIDVSNTIINSSKEKTDILSIDSRINHKKFGLGTIVAINENGEYYTIQFDNLPSTRNIKFGFVERV